MSQAVAELPITVRSGELMSERTKRVLGAARMAVKASMVSAKTGVVSRIDQYTFDKYPAELIEAKRKSHEIATLFATNLITELGYKAGAEGVQANRQTAEGKTISIEGSKSSNGSHELEKGWWTLSSTDKEGNNKTFRIMLPKNESDSLAVKVVTPEGKEQEMYQYEMPEEVSIYEGVAKDLTDLYLPSKDNPLAVTTLGSPIKARPLTQLDPITLERVGRHKENKARMQTQEVARPLARAA
jgi:hypothetical protein